MRSRRGQLLRQPLRRPIIPLTGLAYEMLLRRVASMLHPALEGWEIKFAAVAVGISMAVMVLPVRFEWGDCFESTFAGVAVWMLGCVRLMLM